MGLLEIISMDLRSIRRIINEMIDAKDANATEQGQLNLLLGLKAEVAANHRAEEAVIYDRLADQPEVESLKNRCLNSYNLIEDAIEELEEVEPRSEDWETRLILLKQDLDRQFECEENDLFPWLLETFSATELDEMSHMYSQLRDEILDTVESPMLAHMNIPPVHIHPTSRFRTHS